MKYFTVEEINLMCCFNTSSRMRLIDDMKSVTLNNKDGEIAKLMYKTVRKLEGMTDAEFDALYIAPDSVMDD
ncbi:transposon-transfer assisting family protein [Oscillospiraceae bacterium HCP3S3_F4]